MPCCLRLLAIKVAPSTSLMLFLLLDRADADRRAGCRQVRGPKKSPPGDYAFMAGGGGRGVPPSKLFSSASRARPPAWRLRRPPPAAPPRARHGARGGVTTHTRVRSN